MKNIAIQSTCRPTDSFREIFINVFEILKSVIGVTINLVLGKEPKRVCNQELVTIPIL